jgi:hypothetical protein
MDTSGKLVLAKHNEITSVDIKKASGRARGCTTAPGCPKLQHCGGFAPRCPSPGCREDQGAGPISALAPLSLTWAPHPQADPGAEPPVDGERLRLPSKELDVCEIYPQVRLPRSVLLAMGSHRRHLVLSCKPAHSIATRLRSGGSAHPPSPRMLIQTHFN